MKFDANGGGLIVEMIISPAIQNYGSKIHRSWHITPIEEEGYKSPVQAAEKKENFYLSIQHLTDKKTLVPLGIPAFNKSPENQNIEFEIEITENGIDDFQVEFLHDNKIIQSYYSGEQTLDEVIVTAKGSGNSSNSTTNSQNTQRNYPKGKYHVKWDGFDNNGIYDSTVFTTGKLKARLKGKRNGIEKRAESCEFSFEYKEVNWVDTKINKNTKRIDVTLRVNLRDGGERGTQKDIYDTGSGSYAPIATHYPWGKITKEALSFHKEEPFKSRSKTFEELKNLVLNGINTYWSRRYTNTKGTIINGENWEIIVTAINTGNPKVSLDDILLIYNTNNSWSRSGNPGGNYKDNNLDDNFMSSIPDTGIIQRISYNVGYIKYSNGWFFQKSIDEDVEFKETAAHEIGHEILQALKGTTYSWQHKGSSYYLPQDTKPVEESFSDKITHLDFMDSNGENYPPKGNEIDLMKYYNGKKPADFYERRVANKEELIGLIWLTKLKMK